MILRRTKLVKMEMEDDVGELDELRFNTRQTQVRLAGQNPISEIFGSLEVICLKRKTKPQLSLESDFSLRSISEPVSEISSFQAFPAAPSPNPLSATAHPNSSNNQPANDSLNSVVN